MSHGSARLTVHGRRLIVQRHQAGWKQAHIASAMGVSRKCVKTWIDRYAAQGEAGLATRSSRPHSMPRRTSDEVEQKVLAARVQHRDGPDVLGPKVGVPARTVSRILRRHHVPYLRVCDPMTGDVIRASKHTTVRYKRNRPGELVHMDVKKLGRIPDGGGWRAHGRAAGNRDRKTRIGYDYVHSLVDDHSRLAYSEILPNEKGVTCAAFLERAAAYFAGKGITRIERVMTDNAFAYRHSTDLGSVPTGRSSPPTTNAPQLLRPGSSTTTLNAATAHSADDRQSADCNQRDGRVQLDAVDPCLGVTV